MDLGVSGDERQLCLINPLMAFSYHEWPTPVMSMRQLQLSSRRVKLRSND